MRYVFGYNINTMIYEYEYDIFYMGMVRYLELLAMKVATSSIRNLAFQLLRAGLDVRPQRFSTP